ncbi:MAG TPA: hypothetical protein VFU35_03035 [Jatrophihabitans sp.]|nr:hypothetical protein [Jatrophihabitans sp.]
MFGEPGAEGAPGVDPDHESQPDPHGDTHPDHVDAGHHASGHHAHEPGHHPHHSP